MLSPMNLGSVLATFFVTPSSGARLRSVAYVYVIRCVGPPVYFEAACLTPPSPRSGGRRMWTFEVAITRLRTASIVSSPLSSPGPFVQWTACVRTSACSQPVPMMPLSLAPRLGIFLFWLSDLRFTTTFGRAPFARLGNLLRALRHTSQPDQAQPCTKSWNMT